MPFDGCRKVFFPQGSNVVFFLKGRTQEVKIPETQTTVASVSFVHVRIYSLVGFSSTSQPEIASSNSSRRLFLSVGLCNVQAGSSPFFFLVGILGSFFSLACTATASVTN